MLMLSYYCACACENLTNDLLCRTDGILCTLIRIGSGATDEDKRWYMFDGPVDAIWIESMNTVLDDNKKLCLTSGEIIKLTEARSTYIICINWLWFEVWRHREVAMQP